jgi:hypothetical protein
VVQEHVGTRTCREGLVVFRNGVSGDEEERHYRYIVDVLAKVTWHHVVLITKISLGSTPLPFIFWSCLFITTSICLLEYSCTLNNEY